MPTVRLGVEFFRYTRQAVRRHWRYALACFSVVMLLAVAGAQFLPRTYYSDARLLVRFATTSDSVASLEDTRESEMNSLLQGLRSQEFLERIVQSIGPENILAGRAAEAPHPISISAAETESHSRDPQFQHALARLDKCVSIAVPPNTHNMIISCKADCPKLAQQVVAAFVSLCMDNHLGLHHPADSHVSPKTTRLLEEKSSEAADKLREATNLESVATINAQRKLLEEQIGNLEGQLLANSRDLRNAESTIADLPKAIGGEPEHNSPLAANMPGQSVDEMRQELSRIESKEQELAIKYSDKHPQILAIRDTIAQLKRTLARQALLNGTTAANSLQGRAASLMEQKSQLAAKLKQLNTEHGQLAQIQREHHQAESRSRASADKLDKDRIQVHLGTEPVLGFTLVQPANFVPRPCGPQRIHLLGLGLVVGLLCGVGVALFAALVNPTLRRLTDIEELLQIPVIGQVRVGLA